MGTNAYVKKLFKSDAPNVNPAPKSNTFPGHSKTEAAVASAHATLKNHFAKKPPAVTQSPANPNHHQFKAWKEQKGKIHANIDQAERKAGKTALSFHPSKGVTQWGKLGKGDGMNDKTVDYLRGLMQKGLAPNPKSGENDVDPFGDTDKKRKKPFNTVIDQGTVTKDRVPPSRPNSKKGKGANDLEFNDTEPGVYAGDYANSETGNEGWQSLGKALVNTPWGQQETHALMVFGDTGLGKALVNTPNGPQYLDVKIDQIEKSEEPEGDDLSKAMSELNDLAKSPSSPLQAARKTYPKNPPMKGARPSMAKGFDPSISAVVPGHASQSLIKGMGAMHGATDQFIAQQYASALGGDITMPMGAPGWSMDPSRNLLAGQLQNPALPSDYFQNPQTVMPQMSHMAPANAPSAFAGQMNPQMQSQNGFEFMNSPTAAYQHGHSPASDPRGVDNIPNLLAQRQNEQGGGDGFWVTDR